MTVIAKFKVNDVESGPDWTSVTLNPVYHGNEPEHPNRRFWEATPSGRLNMCITNKTAADYFKVGEVYHLTFEREGD